MSVKQLSINTISNPADREKLYKVIQECSNSMTRVEAEKDFVKESIDAISKNLQLPKKLVARLVKVYHKQNYDEEVATQDQFEQIYESVVK